MRGVPTLVPVVLCLTAAASAAKAETSSADERTLTPPAASSGTGLAGSTTPGPRLAPSASVACIIGPSPADLSDWAIYVATVACDALRRRGIDAGPPAWSAPNAPAAFTVTLDRFGSTFSILVTYEAPMGTIRRVLWAPMQRLSEADQVVSRFAVEMTSNVPPKIYPPRQTIELWLPETARHAHAHHHERVPSRKWQWYLGLESSFLVLPASTEDSPIGETLGAFFSVEFGHVGISLRGFFGGSLSTQDPSEISGVALGARYYSGTGGTNFFLGVGGTHSSIDERAGKDTINYPDLCFFCFASVVSPDVSTGKLEGEGFGVYAEAGVMFRRLRKIPMALSLRADFPFYKLTRSRPAYFDPSDGSTLTTSGPTSRYDVPISLAFGIGF